ncbi:MULTISPECIES: Txe/YoeB family addiction module toxin [Pseudomonas]|jgi:toxin YoeB|uniref:Putative mRNA interferase YoeB n=2 Tax=Pseudomonas fluorescens group TaxID=136843 RepID=A0AB36D354_9PSED|nr:MULTISPECIES: Txe/YoeB family addiction module toxin [Pseudomonas]MBU0526478.1 Txe/YoeB family addiction module toxin [Gammaproteobacteria bacterium]MDF9879092.1 toxin YoeB [Pseudomonas silensiensis]MBA4363330.1 Txe/YoeB family addiction module toxin [Pseudomonas sp.]MBU0822786.1 Txe/YoeB family addiction module toxin [Gammaproteobacteria bacterium]MBU0842820.1 Txe/YoeB family addiction module toxin [Gammaproteobacteria bacterium]
MNIEFTPEGWDDYLWFQQNDKAGLKRINLLITAIQREPFDGLGKPEPLKHNLSGFWSRRITAEHRLVYEVDEGEIRVVMCRYHY